MIQQTATFLLLAFVQQNYGANLGPLPSWEVAGCEQLLRKDGSSSSAAGGPSITALFPRIDCKSTIETPRMLDIGTVPAGTAAVVLSGYTSFKTLSSANFISSDATDGQQQQMQQQGKKSRLFAHQEANVVGAAPGGGGGGGGGATDGDRTGVAGSAHRQPQLELDGLGVSRNSINAIAAGTFARFGRLKMLDMSHNELTELLPAVFQDLRALQWLDLGYNKLTSISEGAFRGVGVVTMLELGNNMLLHLSAAAMGGLDSVAMLGVEHNRLAMLGAGFVAALPNLDASFATADNTLECTMAPMETEGLECTCRAPYQMLHDDDEPGMMCAKQADAADVCKTGTTKNAEIFVDCRNNKLRLVPVNLDPGAHEVLLSGNGISSISAVDFAKMPNLNRLYLENNHVREIEDGALHNLTHVKLDGNPSVCNVASGVPGRCSCADHYAGDGTFCLMRKHASDVCTTSGAAGVQAVAAVAGGGAAADLPVTVDCSSASPPLVLIPAHLPPGTTNLVLRGNRIKVVLANDLSGLGRLEALSLDENSVAVVEQGSFEHSKVLGMLSMEGNPTTCEVDAAGRSSCKCGTGMAGTGGAGCSRRVPTSLACRTHTSNFTGSWTSDPWAQLVAAASAAAASAGGSLDQGARASERGGGAAPGDSGDGQAGESASKESDNAVNRKNGTTPGGGGEEVGGKVAEEWLFTVVNCDGVQLHAVPTVTEVATTTHLMLDNNAIQYVGLEDFALLGKLQSLSMQHNMITLVATGAFASLPALRMVSLAHNLLDALPVGVPSGLEQLDLRSNSISGIDTDNGNVETLLLSLGAGVLLMEGNPSVCSVAASTGVGGGTVDVDGDGVGGSTKQSLVCTCGTGFAGDGTFCIPKPNAAEVCSIGEADEDTGALVVDCNRRGLEMVPAGVPAEATTLLLRDNVIKHVERHDFASLLELRHLDLAGNQIAWIGDDLFRGLDRLEHLDLSPASLSPPHAAEGAAHTKPVQGQCGHADALTELPQHTVVLLGGTAASAAGGDGGGEAGGGGAVGTDEPAPKTGYAPSTECPRDRSRAARQRIEQRIVGALRALGDGVPSLLLTCPLLPHADQYRLHELATHQHNGKGIPCGYCGKTFRDAGSFDRHLDRRHMDRMAVRATVCPNDYCDIVACECMEGCTDEKAAAVRAKCRATVSACFAVMDPTAVRVVAAACDSLGCEDLEEPCDTGGVGVESFLFETLGLGVSSFIIILLLLFCCCSFCCLPT